MVVPIKAKDEVLEVLKKFHPWFVRKYECSIKRLHCDGGGEYIACDKYLEAHGIERDDIPPYTPELNGMAERMNRTLMESALSTMFHANIPMEFWAEAFVHAADIRNRFICPRSENKTSYELLTQTKPRVDHIRVFGSLVWAHIAKENRRKLDPKGNELLSDVLKMVYTRFG